MLARGEQQETGRDAAPSAICPKCGSSRTAVTVHVVDEAARLTLYSCTTCDHRFSRFPPSGDFRL